MRGLGHSIQFKLGPAQGGGGQSSVRDRVAAATPSSPPPSDSLTIRAAAKCKVIDVVTHARDITMIEGEAATRTRRRVVRYEL